MGLQGSRFGEQAVGGGFGGREQTQTGPTRLLSGEIHALQTKNSEVQLGGAVTIKATVCTLPRGHGPRAQPGRWVLLRALETSHSAGTWRGRIRTRGRPSLEVVRYSLAASADGPASPGDRRECFRSSASLSPLAWLQPSWGGGRNSNGHAPGWCFPPFSSLRMGEGLFDSFITLIAQAHQGCAECGGNDAVSSCFCHPPVPRHHLPPLWHHQQSTCRG